MSKKKLQVKSAQKCIYEHDFLKNTIKNTIKINHDSNEILSNHISRKKRESRGS